MKYKTGNAFQQTLKRIYFFPFVCDMTFLHLLLRTKFCYHKNFQLHAVVVPQISVLRSQLFFYFQFSFLKLKSTNVHSHRRLNWFSFVTFCFIIIFFFVKKFGFNFFSCLLLITFCLKICVLIFFVCFFLYQHQLFCYPHGFNFVLLANPGNPLAVS